jgi:ankyrin repeat protein
MNESFSSSSVGDSSVDAPNTVNSMQVRPTWSARFQAARAWVNQAGTRRKRMELGLVMALGVGATMTAAKSWKPSGISHAEEARSMADAVAKTAADEARCDLGGWRYELLKNTKQGSPAKAFEVHRNCLERSLERGDSASGWFDAAARAGNLSALRWFVGAAQRSAREQSSTSKQNLFRKEDLQTALNEALLHGDAHADIISFLFQAGAKESSLSVATGQGAFNAAKRILSKGTVPQEELTQALTNMFQPARSETGPAEEVALTILKRGGKVTGTALAAFCNRDEEAALRLLPKAMESLEPNAIEYALPQLDDEVSGEVVRLLTKRGVDWTFRDGQDDGPKPLITAIERRRESLMRRFVEAGAPVNFFYKDGSSALQTSVECTFSNEVVTEASVCGRITEYLLDHGAEVNRRFPDGKTPLYAAAETGNGRVVRALLAHGARKEDRVLRSTALDIAISKGNETAAQILHARGAILHAPQ